MELNYDKVTVSELQKRVTEAEIRKGHIGDDIKTKCFLLMEEVGEMVKAIRILLGMKIHSKTAKHDLEDEIGDVFFLLIAIANRAGIHPAKALISKIEKDDLKVYKNANAKD
ncbi:MAG: MazG nucleotide pyrophosphohydrolase domain-containing protein [Candidatus Pacebacteria bacterium]|nr:MazG nucleotide pyrophosphohydrolase domain-containing protein [Fermentimonas sp.]MDD4804419.1 MazG nucleotide pyrophosphohydrolase domain-containing protein [Candidatus Paceibacterota bacterium]